MGGSGGAGQRWDEGTKHWTGHEGGVTGREITGLHGFHKLLQIPSKVEIRVCIKCYHTTVWEREQ